MTQPKASVAAVVTKKIRCTEYMKKFREPKWETFSKCYEDSLRYRLTRRVMEHSHKPWVWNGWDRGSDSSGRSTPRPSRSKTAPLSVAPQAHLFRGRDRLAMFEPPPEPKPPFVDAEAQARDTEASVAESGPGVSTRRGPPPKDPPASSAPSETTETDAGPLESSDEEAAKPGPRRRPRRPPATAHHGGGASGEESGAVRKPPRAKSQPSLVAKETLQRSGRHHWLDVQQQVQNRVTADACVQTTRRSSEKRALNPERRRARSADQEKSTRAGLTVVDSHWVTEYMRCFSARLR